MEEVQEEEGSRTGVDDDLEPETRKKNLFGTQRIKENFPGQESVEEMMERQLKCLGRQCMKHRGRTRIFTGKNSSGAKENWWGIKKSESGKAGK